MLQSKGVFPYNFFKDDVLNCWLTLQINVRQDEISTMFSRDYDGASHIRTLTCVIMLKKTKISYNDICQHNRPHFKYISLQRQKQAIIWRMIRISQIAKFMGSTWGPPGSCRPQMGPMLAPWTLLSGMLLEYRDSTCDTLHHKSQHIGMVQSKQADLFSSQPH